MGFTQKDIVELYEKSLNEAIHGLSLLAVAENREPTAIRGLNGWVFEQTIRYCLSRELGDAGLCPEMKDQETLRGRAKIDLLVGRVAIELKARGFFGLGDFEKYREYRKTAEEKGWVYFYLTLQEDQGSYRKATEGTFGKDRAFFLDVEGDWKRFVTAVVAILQLPIVD